jgi:hypothetical protein
MCVRRDDAGLAHVLPRVPAAITAGRINTLFTSTVRAKQPKLASIASSTFLSRGDLLRNERSSVTSSLFSGSKLRNSGIVCLLCTRALAGPPVACSHCDAQGDQFHEKVHRSFGRGSRGSELCGLRQGQGSAPGRGSDRHQGLTWRQPLRSEQPRCSVGTAQGSGRSRNRSPLATRSGRDRKPLGFALILASKQKSRRPRRRLFSLLNGAGAGGRPAQSKQAGPEGCLALLRRITELRPPGRPPAAP